MTDDLERDEPDEQEQQRVRRLLADLAATDVASPAPVPADVAARLDAALVDAAKDSRTQTTTTTTATTTTTTSGLAPVVPLRRRWGPALVAAAAVVAIAGIGVAVVGQQPGDQSGQQSGQDDAMSSAGGSSSGSSGSEESGATSQDLDTPAPSGEGRSDLVAPLEGDEGTDTGRMLPAPYLTLGGFADGAATLVAQGQVASGVDAAVDARELERVQGSGCVVPESALGAPTLVNLEGDPAVLVVAPPQEDRQRVEVLECGTGEALADAEVPAAP